MTATLPTRTLVYSYGVHYKWTKNLPQVVRNQLFLGNELRNRLVELWKEYDEVKVAAIEDSYPDLKAAKLAVEAAAQRVRDVKDLIGDQRVAARSKRVRNPALYADLDQAVADKAAALKQKAAARAAANAANPSLRDRLNALEKNEKKARYDATYKPFTRAGLFHCTHWDIESNGMRSSIKQVIKARHEFMKNPKIKHWPTLRFHRFDGSGRMLVKVQQRAGMIAPMPEVITVPGNPYWNQFSLSGWVHPDDWAQLSRAEQRKAGRITARLRVTAMRPKTATTPAVPAQVLEIPIQVDRPLPADAVIKMVRLVVRGVGSAKRATLDITVSVPVKDPQPAVSRNRLALHVGWRSDEAGRRVMTWQAEEPIAVPPELRRYVPTIPDGTAGKIVAPQQWHDRKEAIARTRGERRRALNEIAAELIAWLGVHGPIAHPDRIDPATGKITHFTDRQSGGPLMIDARTVARWITPSRRTPDDLPVSAFRRMTVLARAWSDTPPVSPAGAAVLEMGAMLEDWRRRNKNLWDAESFAERRLLNHRTDVYRRIATMFAGQTTEMVIDKVLIGNLKRNDDEFSASDDLPNSVKKKINRERDMAAPGEIRNIVKALCTRDGHPLVEVMSHQLTQTCYACGHRNPVDVKTTHEVTCANTQCKATYDVDWNATAHMLDPQQHSLKANQVI